MRVGEQFEPPGHEPKGVGAIVISAVGKVPELLQQPGPAGVAEPDLRPPEVHLQVLYPDHLVLTVHLVVGPGTSR